MEIVDTIVELLDRKIVNDNGLVIVDSSSKGSDSSSSSISSGGSSSVVGLSVGWLGKPALLT